MGYLARVAPEKGLHVLAEAYKQVKEVLPSARLEVAGYMAPDCEAYLGDIEKRLADWRCSETYEYHGVLDRPGKIAFLRKLDVMSSPRRTTSRKAFRSSKQWPAAPLVQPRRGAFTEIVESTGGGILVPPDDPTALAGALLKIANDKKLAAELGANGFRGVREHYSAAHMADRLLEAYAAFGNATDSTASGRGGAACSRLRMSRKTIPLPPVHCE